MSLRRLSLCHLPTLSFGRRRAQTVVARRFDQASPSPKCSALYAARCLVVGASALSAVGAASEAQAATLVETATLGPSTPNGLSLNSSQWFGARFSTGSGTTHVFEVGGHMYGDGEIFAAILPFDFLEGAPPCPDLSCAVAVVLFELPNSSGDVVVPFDVDLDEGSWVVAFGSTGPGGSGVAPENNPEIGDPTFLRRSGLGWGPTSVSGLRFFVTGQTCGDGIPDDPEACDDGNDVETDACLTTCVQASCGDGFAQSGEEACDDGNDVDTDACLSNCVAASCGDGFVQDGEEACDDGNDDDTDACLSSCAVASCGDGFVQDGVEDCDDGNRDDDDACSNDCTENLDGSSSSTGPSGSTGGDDSDGTTGESGGPPAGTTAPVPETSGDDGGSSSGGEDADGADASGCSCSTSDRGSNRSAVAGLALLLLGLRRRRPGRG